MEGSLVKSEPHAINGLAVETSELEYNHNLHTSIARLLVAASTLEICMNCREKKILEVRERDAIFFLDLFRLLNESSELCASIYLLDFAVIEAFRRRIRRMVERTKNGFYH